MRPWKTIREPFLDRHSHTEAYAALILAGGYEEAGDQGRFRTEVGDVVLHDRFEAHLDRFLKSGVVLIDLPLPSGLSFTPGIARVDDPDAIVCTAEKDLAEAGKHLLSMLQGCETHCIDWPDELAAALMKNPSLRLLEWGERRGLPP